MHKQLGRLTVPNEGLIWQAACEFFGCVRLGQLVIELLEKHGPKPSRSSLQYLRLEVTVWLTHLLAHRPARTRTNGTQSLCPQLYPLAKPLSDVAHAVLDTGSPSTPASLYTAGSAYL